MKSPFSAQILWATRGRTGKIRGAGFESRGVNVMTV